MSTSRGTIETRPLDLKERTHVGFHCFVFASSAILPTVSWKTLVRMFNETYSSRLFIFRNENHTQGI